MKISIIVPVYNGEQFISKTISNILNQPYRDIELILINDGSTDSSLEICRKYAHIDDRIVLITKKNGGISSARNTGISVATGEWVSFIDQDDYIFDDIYYTLTKNLDNKTDLSVAGKELLLVDENDKIVKSIVYNYVDRIVENKCEILDLILNKNNDGCIMHLWNCLYKLDVIKENNVRFNSSFKLGHEDTLFNIQYASCINKISINSRVVYRYLRRYKTSTSLKGNPKYLCDFQEYSMEMYKHIEKNFFGLFDNDFLFSYYYRLGINLFIQYGSNVKDTSDVLSIAYKISKSKRFVDNDSKIKQVVYSALIKLTELECFNLLKIIISIIRKKKKYG